MEAYVAKAESATAPKVDEVGYPKSEHDKE
jgi:hypothetical protein